jgi:hypothetical protein
MKVGHGRVQFDKLSYTENGLLTDYRFFRTYVSEQFVPRLWGLTGAARKLGSEPIYVTQRSYAWRKDDNRILGVTHEFNLSGLTRIMRDGEELEDDCGKKRAIHVANRCSIELQCASGLRHSRHERRYAASV